MSELYEYPDSGWAKSAVWGCALPLRDFHVGTRDRWHIPLCYHRGHGCLGARRVYMQCHLSVRTAVSATPHHYIWIQDFRVYLCLWLFLCPAQQSSPQASRKPFLTFLSYIQVHEIPLRYRASTANCREHLIPWWTSNTISGRAAVASGKARIPPSL